MIDEWRFSPKAAEAIAATVRGEDARLNIWHGAVRSSKTVSSLVAWSQFIARAPKGDLLMPGKTERTLQRNAINLLRFIVGEANFSQNKGSGELRVYGRRVFVVGANDDRSEGKIRGMTLAGAYVDELTLIPEPFFTMLLSRLSLPGSKLYATTNPDSPHHWLKVRYLDRAEELGLASWHFRLEDNPALDPAYVAALKAEYGVGTLWYQRFIEGEWRVAEGAVFDFFDEHAHVLTALPDRDPDHLDVAIDYGTSNATSAGLYGAWERSGATEARVVRLRGYYHSGRDTGRSKTDAEYADDLQAWLGEDAPKLRHVVLDPSAASFKAELRKRGFRVRDAANQVLDGIRTVSGLLKGGQFAFGPDPSNLPAIRQVQGYLWDPRAQDQGLDKPLKQADHACDEIRYALHTLHRHHGVTPGAARKAQGFA